MEYKLGIKKSDLKEGEPVSVEIESKHFAVVLLNGKVHVLDGTCTHEQGNLGEGYIDNNELICPLHAGAYNIETGAANENTPWVTSIKAYGNKIDETGEIIVEI